MPRRSSKRSRPPVDEVAKILKQRYPSYSEPLKFAWTWTREATVDSLAKSARLLTALKKRYPHVLSIRYELALCLVKSQEVEKAETDLKRAAEEFTILDEDTYCLWARIPKDRGDQALRDGNLPEAERLYRDSIDRYERAFEIGKGRFPGINLATLRLVLASVLPGEVDEQQASPDKDSVVRGEIEALQARSQQIARLLIAARSKWVPVLDDDDIWLRATEAEARLLLQQFDQAGQLYSAALRQRDCQRFHVDSMKAQSVRICEAFTRLHVTIKAPFKNLDKLFSFPLRPGSNRGGNR